MLSNAPHVMLQPEYLGDLRGSAEWLIGAQGENDLDFVKDISVHVCWWYWLSAEQQSFVYRSLWCGVALVATLSSSLSLGTCGICFES